MASGKEHYTRNTESVLKWCNTCMRLTKHPVSDGRVGRCGEHESPEYSKAQEKAKQKAEDEAKQPKLF